MSVFTILTVLFLLVLGAVIAWAGDVIGYRLGKSRRSLFGMRPRTTARFVGMVLGALLPIAGLFVAALGSEHVRLALFHIEDLKREQGELQAKLATATDAAEHAAQRSDALIRDIAVRERALEESRARLGEVRSRLAAAQENLKTVTARGAALRAQVTELQKARETLRQTLSRLQAQHDRLEKQYRKTSSDLASTEKRLVSARKENNELRASAEDLRTRGDQLQREVRKSQTALESAQEELTGIQRRIGSAEKRAQEAEAEAELARRRVVEEQHRYGLFKYRAEHPFSDEGVIVEQGQELVRFVVDGKQTQDQIVSVLYEMLHFASMAGARYGAPTGENGRTVKVVAPVPFSIRGDQKATEADIVAEVASQLRTAGAESYVVRVLVARRLFKEDQQQADVAFVSVPNKLAFAKGQTVLETEIDGSTPRVNVFGALWNLIPQIRLAARATGMLPDPETGQFGEAPAQQLLDALDKIQGIHGRALVRAVAARDTYTAEPLVIDLQVTPGKQEGRGG